MENQESYIPFNSENYEKQLKARVFSAYNNAKSLDNYEEKIAELRKLRTKKIEPNFTPEDEERFHELDKEIKSCEVLVDSVMEYKKLLELFPLSEEKIHSLLNHENAHANTAEKLPSQIFNGFRVRFVKNAEGNVAIKPSAKTSNDYGYPESQRLEEEIQVFEAPLHAGDTLSVSDKANIKELRNKLDNL